jgi:L-ascorbate metabolism protein UlaG (beta-lactamase superfamily)
LGPLWTALPFIGTATTIVRLGSFTVLTDPNFLHRGQRAYLGKGLWSPRLTEPAMQPADLPSLDAVVLSHSHGDHFDPIARRHLDHTVPVLTAMKTITLKRVAHTRLVSNWSRNDTHRGHAMPGRTQTDS